MIFVRSAFATCPVCVIVVGSGLFIAEKLGVDDLIAAVWIGGLITAMAVVFADKFRLIKLPWPKVSWTVISYLLTVATLWIQGKLNNPYCKIWGVCKIWLGITIGTLAIWLGIALDKILRKKNQGKVFFPFQKVVIPFLIILIISLVFYFTIC